jgi:hypothetical protein
MGAWVDVRALLSQAVIFSKGFSQRSSLHNLIISENRVVNFVGEKPWLPFPTRGDTMGQLGTEGFPLLLERTLPTETNVESRTSQSKSGISVNISDS